jgi:hypothetical protein
VLSTDVARGNWLNEGTALVPVACSPAARRLGIDGVHPISGSGWETSGSTSRASPEPDGACQCLDVRCSDKLDEDHRPFCALLHLRGLLLRLRLSLPPKRESLGTLGLHEPRLREFARRRWLDECSATAEGQAIQRAVRTHTLNDNHWDALDRVVAHATRGPELLEWLLLARHVACATG